MPGSTFSVDSDITMSTEEACLPLEILSPQSITITDTSSFEQWQRILVSHISILEWQQDVQIQNRDLKNAGPAFEGYVTGLQQKALVIVQALTAFLEDAYTMGVFNRLNNGWLTETSNGLLESTYRYSMVVSKLAWLMEESRSRSKAAGSEVVSIIRSIGKVCTDADSHDQMRVDPVPPFIWKGMDSGYFSDNPSPKDACTRARTAESTKAQSNYDESMDCSGRLNTQAPEAWETDVEELAGCTLAARRGQAIPQLQLEESACA
jgi:hypothetical protein